MYHLKWGEGWLRIIVILNLLPPSDPTLRTKSEVRFLKLGLFVAKYEKTVLTVSNSKKNSWKKRRLAPNSFQEMLGSSKKEA